MRLQPVEAEAYEAEGYFLRRRVFGGEELARLRDAVESVVAVLEGGDLAARQREIDGHHFVDLPDATLQVEPENPSRLRVVEPVVHRHPGLDALVDDSRLVEPMADLVGGPVALFTDKLNLKRPRLGSEFRWHQDAPYWAHVSPHLERLPNAIVFLDASDGSNGGFRILRGSHRNGPLRNCAGEGALGTLFVHPDVVAAHESVELDAPAGSVCFFHPFAVHGSTPNGSDRERRALVLTYQPAGFPMFKRNGERPAG